MRRKLERIYLEKDKRKRHLLSLKNRYFAIIYKGCLDGKTAKRIHKELFDATIEKKPQYADKYLLAMMAKTADKAKRLRADDADLLAVAIYGLFHDAKINEKAKKLINHDTQRRAEREKDALISRFVDQSRADGKWFYLASSHDDCAKDHLPYQGRMYVDEKAPAEARAYAFRRNWPTVQWVMGDPAWFITRPNCRHYFVSLTADEVERKSVKRLKRKYKTHKKEGDRDLQTPRRAAIEEYEDRLAMLSSLYREKATQKLRDEILKAKMLIQRWKAKPKEKPE